MEITLNRQSFKKALGVFLVVVLLFGMCSPAAPFLPKVSFEAVAAGDMIASGTCGGNWVVAGYDDHYEPYYDYDGAAKYWLYDDGTLEITGEGEISGEVFDSWDFDYCYYVTKILINSGITKINSGAFGDLYNLKEVIILNPDCHMDGIGWDDFPNGTVFYGYEGSTTQAFVEYYASFEEFEFFVYCPHENIVEQARNEQCYTFGNVEGIKCLDCGRYTLGGEKIKPTHTDNGDGICERCEKNMPVAAGGCGACYDEMDWLLYPVNYYLYDDGTLEIFGEGAIEEGGYSFSHIANDIKNVVIYDGITAIGVGAFRYCYNLENVIISETVTKLDYIYLYENKGAFENCYNLKTVTIPSKVSEIPANAFKGCDALESVTILNLGCEISDECGIRQDAIIYGYENSTANSFAYGNSSRFRVYCTHENTEAVDALAFSCYSDGHEEGIRCNDCGRWVTGGEEIYASHLDENADKICDRCAKTMPKWENFVGGNMETVNNRKYCDDKARAYFYDDGTLEVFGEGEVKKSWYGGGNESSYGGLFLDTKKLVIHEGITHINSDCFKKFLYIEEVTLPSTVRYVSSGAFADCVRLSKLIVLNPECGFSADGTSTPGHTVIYGYSGSSAETHAKHWLFKFVPLDREHDHEYESKITLKPTCTSKGIEEFTCYCGASYTDVVVPNSHYDLDDDRRCDTCGTRLYTDSETEKPDDDTGTTDTPEKPDIDNGANEQPEEEKNIFESFFESIINFFRNLINIFNFFNM